MALYWDTSALVKLLVKESDNEEMKKNWESAGLHGTSCLSFIELESALAMKFRRGDLPKDQYAELREWIRRLSFSRRLTILPLSEITLKIAAEYPLKHELRSLNALHLASAVVWKEILNKPIRLVTADTNLLNAAKREGC